MNARLLSIVMAGGLFAALPRVWAAQPPSSPPPEAVAVRDWGKGKRPPLAALRADEEGVRLLLAGEYEAAIGEFNRSLKLHSRNPRALANRGVARSRLGGVNEALADFEAALAAAPELRATLKPRIVEARVRRGRARLAEGRLEEALADFFTAIRADRKDPRGYAAVAEAGRASRKLDTCVSYASQALELAPETLEGLEVRAACSAELGRRGDAVRDLDRALALEPGRADLLASRALLQLALGRKTAARRDAKRALELDPALAEKVGPALR